MDDIQYYHPDNRQTKNSLLIKKAFRDGFKAGVAFLNESESMNACEWRRKAFKQFVEENKIKI